MENTFAEFTARMVEKVRGTYPEGWRIETMEVLQTNDVVYTGLRVSKGNSSVSPVVYLEKFYAAYLEGVPFETLASEVIGVLKENEWEGDAPSCLFDFDFVKERIIFRLLNFEKNRKLLKDVPFIRFCDLAVVFHVLLKADTEGEIAMLIHKEHMHRWDKNLSALDLMELAQGNTPRLLPASVRKMGEVLSDISSELGEKEGAEKAPIMDGLGKNIPMYVVSNSSGLCGASVVLYPNVLRQLAWKTRSDLVVFPSSPLRTTRTFLNCGRW